MSRLTPDDDWSYPNRLPSLPEAMQHSRAGWSDCIRRGSPAAPEIVSKVGTLADVTTAEVSAESDFPEQAAELEYTVHSLTRAFFDALFEAPAAATGGLGPITGFGVGLSQEAERRINDTPAEAFWPEIASESSPALVVYATETLSRDDAARLLASRVRTATLHSPAIELRVLPGGKARAAFRQRRVPACGGCSISHHAPYEDYGTFGSLAVGRSGRRRKRLLVLSNAHVLAPFDVGRRGDAILHPARGDNGQFPEDQIAILERIAAPIHGAPNLVDAATARANPKLVCRGVLYEHDANIIVRRPPAGAVRATRGEAIRKSGRTTGTTQGFVRATGIVTKVFYPTTSHGFIDQIEIVDRPGQPRPLALAGDSGSISWSVRGGELGGAVGLLMAVRSDPATGRNTAFLNRMRHVLTALDVSLYT